MENVQSSGKHSRWFGKNDYEDMKILQLNLNHCENAHDLLTQTARELQVDVVLVSEPFKRVDNGCWVYDTGGKAAIWACGKKPFQTVAQHLNYGFARAKIDGIHFYSCYAPPSLTLEDFIKFLDELTEDCQKYFPLAIAGDFNAWATEWGSKITNTKGQALMESLSSLDVVLLNSGNTPTFTRGDASSIVDLTFVSSSLAKGNDSWRITDIYTASDHQAIYWETSGAPQIRAANGRTSRGWKTSAFDSATFQVAFGVESTEGNGDANEKAGHVTKRLAAACDATMPRKHGSSHLPPVYWWNETISALRKLCIRAKRLSQRNRKKPHSEQRMAEYKEARQKLKKAIKESKKETWKNLLGEVDSDPFGRPYKVVMSRLKKRSIASPTDPVLLKKIVTALFPQQTELDHSIEQISGEEIPPVTEDELLEACNRIGDKKAPGLDSIPNVALKAAIKTSPPVFLDVYNTCIQEGTFPDRWKRQRLVLLPKGNKPPEDPSSYRPLCMLDTAGKVLERIIHGRIEAVVESQLADNQYGFRRGRSTVDAIDLVVNTAKEAISGTRWKRGAKKYCLVATLDIKNAFNSASWKVILEALARMNVPNYLQKIIASYFSDRVLEYDTDSGVKEYRVTGGVPQGSVLGPLLWNIMYDGLLKLTLPEEAQLVAFADDVAVIIVAKYLEEINWAFDKTFDVIKNWMALMGLKLAEHKTEAVLITGRKHIESVTLRVGDFEFESQPFVRYLGVMIDARLKFWKHAECTGAKASTVVSTLSRIMPNVGGPKQGRRMLLASVVTSVLMYGVPVWAESLRNQETRRKVASVYRVSALRVTCAFRTVSEDAAQVIAGMLPIQLLADERKYLYHQKKKEDQKTAAELKSTVRLKSICQWQQQWDASGRGRWTHRLIPKIEVWINRGHGELNYYLTQMLSGHGCYREYLHKFKHDDSPECPTCTGLNEDAEHVFFVCPRYANARDKWEALLGAKTRPENMVAAMLHSEANWEATCAYATEVLKDLRTAERERKRNGALVAI